jgi:hypothetical protein
MSNEAVDAVPAQGSYDRLVAEQTTILKALVSWVEAADGQGALLDLVVDRPCSLCGGTTFCPEGCPMAVCELDYEKTAHRRERPIREHEYRRGEEGWRYVLLQGRECDACGIYGRCLSCTRDGRERRAARKQGSTYLVDSVPLYSTPGFGLTDPTKITAAQVRREIEAQQVGQLELLGA